MTTQAPTAGIVGLGYGRAHLAGFQAAGCKVVALCQRNEDAARELAAKHGVPEVFGRWEDMIARAKPAIVAIATPPALHLPILIAAMESGAHVVCEKPLAMNRAEALEMIAIAKRTGRAAITGFNWRYPPAMRRFKEMVDAGHLGRVFHVNGRWFNAGWASESTAGTWRMNRAIAGHGAMGDQGVHLVDMIQWLFGRFVRVAATSGIAYASRNGDAEDDCSVLGELESGARVSFTVTRIAHGTGENTLEAYGTDGGLSLRVPRAGKGWHIGELQAAKAGELLKTVPLETTPGIDEQNDDRLAVIGRMTVAPMIRGMLEAIAQGKPPSPSLEDGMRAQAVLDAVRESITRRTWVDVPKA